MVTISRIQFKMQPIDLSLKLIRFCSGCDGDIAMLLARPTDGSGGHGSKGLSLYYGELKNSDGKMNGIRCL